MPDYYTLIKSVHVSFVALSGLLFFVRGIWMICDSSLLTKKWVRVGPHIIDSLLLISAVMLVIHLQQYPFSHDWLTAKTVALLVYIAFGMLAIRHGRTKRGRVVAWILALVSFGYIVLVALTRSPTIIG